MLIKLFQFFLPQVLLDQYHSKKKEKTLQNKPWKLPETAALAPSPIIHTLQMKHIS